MTNIRKPINPWLYLFVISFLGLLWWTTKKEFIRANKKLSDLTKIAGIIDSISIGYTYDKYHTYYYVDFTLQKRSEKLGLEAGESYESFQAVQEKLRSSDEVTVYYDPNGNSNNKGYNIDIYQVENKNGVIHSINEENNDALSQALLSLILSLVITFIAVRAHIVRNNS